MLITILSHWLKFKKLKLPLVSDSNSMSYNSLLPFWCWLIGQQTSISQIHCQPLQSPHPIFGSYNTLSFDRCSYNFFHLFGTSPSDANFLNFLGSLFGSSYWVPSLSVVIVKPSLCSCSFYSSNEVLYLNLEVCNFWTGLKLNIFSMESTGGSDSSEWMWLLQQV